MGHSLAFHRRFCNLRTTVGIGRGECAAVLGGNLARKVKGVTDVENNITVKDSSN